jgi:hypothetical protein
MFLLRISACVRASRVMAENDQLTDEDFAKLTNAMRNILSDYDPNMLDKQKVEKQLSKLVNNAEHEIEMMRQVPQERRRSAWQKLRRGKNPFSTCINQGCTQSAIMHEELNKQMRFCSPSCQKAYHQFLSSPCG